MTLSAIITTKNEEENIARCIRSLYFADEVIVVDDYSNDKTVEIAKQLGANVIMSHWEGYGQQKNTGLLHAQYDWVFFIDADEEVPQELAQAIKKTIKNPSYDVYWVRVLDIFLGRPLHHLTGNNPRLLRRGKAKWTNRPVHEQVALQDTASPVKLGDDVSGVINYFLLHHSHKTIASYFKKMHRYTALDAQQMQKTQVHRSGRSVAVSPLLPFQLAMRQFVKLAFWRRGVLDGYPGIMWSVLSAFYEWEMALKYLKLQR